MFERFVVGLDYDLREILVPELVFEYPTISQLPVLHPPSIFTFGLYLRRRLLSFVMWLIFIRLVYDVREIYCWVGLSYLRDLLYLN